MNIFIKILKNIGAIFILCLFVGFVVSSVEKRKGWVEGHTPSFYERKVKRVLDFGVSLLAVFFLWPVFLIIGIAVRGKLGTPVLFKQERPGLGGKVFEIQKFRTMTDEKDKNGDLLSDEERLTSFGKMLRSTSLDELPELFNILRGDMAIVGPRPLLVEYLPYYSEKERKRHDVRPGLTGLAQIHGRNNLGWNERFQLDVQYSDNITFFQDFKICVQTIKKVLLHSDVSEDTRLSEGNFAEMRKKEIV